MRDLTYPKTFIKFLCLNLKKMQQLSLRNSFVRMKLGLHNHKDTLKKHISTENVLPEKNVYFEVEVPLDSLSPQKLLDVSKCTERDFWL